MTNLVTKASEIIYQMDSEQLKQVVDAIQLKRQYLAKQAIRNFVVGDMVQFTSKRTGGKVNATVENIGGEKWRVPATMLTKLSDIGVSA